MLSKKRMAFSPTRLITILVLAFIVPSAMAQDFDATLSVKDISFADGSQVTGGTVEVTVKFGKVVSIDDISDKISLVIYNKFGGVIGTETATDGVAGRVAVGYDNTVPQDGKTYLLSFSVAAGTNENDTPSSARLRVAEGIVAAALDDDERSQTADIEIHFVGSDLTPSDPMPVSIELTNNLLVPADGFTGASFQIIVTLSEQPKDGKFTTDHLDVDKGTASDSVYLGPIEPPEGQSGTGRDGDYHRFLFTITPQTEDSDLVIKIGSFEDQEKPTPMKYTPPSTDLGRTEGRDMLTVKIGKRELEEVIIVIEITVPIDTVIPGPGDSNPAENGVGDNTAATETVATEKATAAETAKTDADDTSVMIPMEGQIYISEIMFARGVHGTLPQWIEIANGSRTEQVNLSGWTLTIENATADVDVSVDAKAVFTIPEGTRIDPSGQNDTPSTILVVTEQGRNNLEGAMAAGQVVNLWVDQWSELARLGITERRYSLLSDVGFKITLAPPAPDVTPSARDVVGNLADDGTVAWALPMREEGRSSIIRRHAPISGGPSEPKDGTMLENWALAADMNFTQSTHLNTHSYYGLPIDVGTPGFRAGGALPVELSHFRPARDKTTGQVMITWSTESELNNAGFFIKRRQQRGGAFVVVNSTMVPGAGTTSEKQFYTYTDTTAQPNVVYYYQIEDVSFDGDRRTLTGGVRLRGYVGVAGNAITTWGGLKIQE